MIGRISGTLLEKLPPELLIEVNGLGYEVHAPMTTIYALPEVGQGVTLHTHFVVREDAQILYGFSDKQQRALFRALIKVSGVGPKLALAILSGIETDTFVRSVHDGDSATLVRIPGIGKKTAERLIVEMKDRLKEWQVDSDLPLMAAANPAPASQDQWIQEAEGALIALGYKPTEAAKAIAAIKEPVNGSEDLIRLALKGMLKQ
ncbi:Holliday junction branch migration protein RuvA [Bermanella marisrubri]|uniref:Holliday junction branch migration complex subunit RuvA n=1 Tax=Bermanella marisrubri TaxID=207949 RepID=Q1N0T8_9GAMM|nr:Holliday junction branch migration protein RuvA [Bermanella marisrubri]EAT11745.1 Holliday junction DNA helicase motor protein [Oceanobacter sp. RED65] [Bermanella marisrubri]QIZ83782.1 Holliday junction branch migration protein RuvA [Bermanella marisrubri]